MAVVTVRKLSDSTLQALKSRAERHGHCLEQEVRRILEGAVRPGEGLGNSLLRIGRKWRQLGGGTLRVQGTDCVEPARFE
ncbi:hypothetical protein CDL60_05320 [Roseateles noduli]|nr:hypothetical protein CDL60_05320 [Roseateles noduli]